MNMSDRGINPFRDVTYGDYDFTWDGKAFASDVRTWCDQLEATVSELMDELGLSHAYLSSFSKKESMPTMRNFLTVCNFCDLDPRDYFRLVRATS